ncbi:MAG: DUF2062 domain-containing protein [Rhodobacteraceae bacterium]|nr:DUF2062 domain-containing protein [Paracoccaceae bacterium]
MFKRRKQLSWGSWIKEGVYPRAGWRRVINYVGHRVKRLPGSPHKIALGFACGVFVTFSPFFGLHFLFAVLLAWVLRGNVLASLLGTFVGNPITFPFIATTSYQLGLIILGYGREETVWSKIKGGFADAFETIWANTKSLFGAQPTSWDGLAEFFHGVFLPYLVGGIAPGLIVAFVFYSGGRPVIAAYQRRRKGRLMRKIKELRPKRKSGADEV